MEKNRDVRNQKHQHRHSAKDRDGKKRTTGTKKKQAAGNFIQTE